MSRRIMRTGMWTMAAFALALGGLLALALVRPTWWSRGGVVLGVTSGRAEIAWSTCTLKRQSIAYNMNYPQGNAAILVAPRSAWRPSMAEASVSTGSAPGPGITHTLRVVYVPLWPLAMLASGGAGLLWWRTRRVFIPGHCRTCGYDLRGLAADRCPECGTSGRGAIARVVRRFAAWCGAQRVPVAASLLAACTTVLSPSSWAAGQPEPSEPQPGMLTVRVVDASGAPVAGAEVGSAAFGSKQGSENGDLALSFFGEQNERARTADKNGRVTIDPRWVFYGADDTHPQAIIAWTPDHARMGLLQVSRADLGRQMDLSIAPVCRLTVKLTSTGLEGLGRKLTWSNVYVHWKESRPLARDATNGVHEFLLPPGDYKLYAYGTDAYTETPELRIEPGEKEKTTEIDLAPNRLVQLIGKPAPELTKIKGWKNGEPTTLAALKGKVVILDFWGYWCGPCVHSMPELMGLHDKYKDKGLVILAVHDDSAESIADMDHRLEKARSEIWGGRDLPFLVALDGGGQTQVEGRKGKAAGATTAAYGINSFPTTVLIDRDGIVQGRCRASDTDRIERALGLKN